MMEISFGSVCSGIEAASVAWTPIGWEPAWFSEIEPFPSALLDHHYPETPNLGDMTALPGRILNGEVEAPDVFCGGTPCQAFSVAGKRQSLDDERGNLSLTFCEIANAIDLVRSRDGKQPTIIFWENVPGVLNTKDNAFGCFLGELAGESCALEPSGGRWTNAGFVLGPKRAIAWRVLDAQYFGVAQRRRRVFVVASARDGFDPAKVLFEFDGVRRDIAPSRETRQEVTGNAGEGTCKSDGWPTEIASTLNASFGSKLGLENQHIDGGAPLFVPDKAYGVPGNWIGRKPENGGNSTQFMHEVAPTQTATDKHGVIAISPSGQESLTSWEQQGRRVQGMNGVSPTLMSNPAGGMKLEPVLAFNSRQDPVSGEVFGALDTCSPQAQAVALRGREGAEPTEPIGLDEEQNPRINGFGTLKAREKGGGFEGSVMLPDMAVRRLTPVECERLMGFPDGYTQIPWRGKASDDCPDGHRYKALGNSWAVPNVRWIGERINEEIEKR